MSSFEDIDFGEMLSAPSRRAGQTLDGRRQAERKKMHEADRRRVMRTGRTIQCNFKVREEFKKEFFAYATSEGLLPVELLERVWGVYKDMKGLR